MVVFPIKLNGKTTIRRVRPNFLDSYRYELNSSEKDFTKRDTRQKVETESVYVYM